MKKQFKILVSCYACSPYRGSEPGMGWHFIYELSKYHEIHVITEKEKWEKDINKFLTTNKIENLNFYFIKKKRNRKLRKLWPPSYYWFYKEWQKKAYALANKLNKKEQFDLVHQLNMVGYREPGYLWKMNLPFVWGPIGGTQNVPWKLFSSLNLEGKVFYGARNIINSFQKFTLQRPRLAAQKTPSALIVATPDIKKDIFKLWNKKSEIITEIGSNNIGDFKVEPAIRLENEPLKLIWSGQHTGGKALNILLRSLALLSPKIDWELHILGKGKETKSWKKLADTLGVSKHCKWYGWLSKNEALSIVNQGHLQCITSIKDLTSTVTLEAISFGLPVICLNHCGFAHVITKNCGIKIEVGKLKNMHSDFKNAIELLYNHENLRQKLSIGALNRAKAFSWEEKGNKLNAIYANLMQ